MITGWLVKLLVGLGLFGFAVFELGSPVFVRLQLDGVAHDAADAAAFELRQGRTPAVAEESAKTVAVENHADLDRFTVDPNRTVRVTVSRDARSYLLKRFDPTEDWYHVTVSVTSSPARR